MIIVIFEIKLRHLNENNLSAALLDRKLIYLHFVCRIYGFYILV